MIYSDNREHDMVERPVPSVAIRLEDERFEGGSELSSVVGRCLRAEVTFKDVQSLAFDTFTCRSIVKDLANRAP